MVSSLRFIIIINYTFFSTLHILLHILGVGGRGRRHRDYKRIEWASREKSRDKLNKGNRGSGIYVPGIIPSSVHLCVYLCISAFFIERCSQADPQRMLIKLGDINNCNQNNKVSKRYKRHKNRTAGERA